MTDTNWKEMLAGLFLSKFSEQGYRRLGYASFKEAYEGLSNLVGGNPLSVRNYRDEFDPVFPNGRAGYFGRKMMPSRKEMLDRFGSMDLESMAQLIEEQYLGAETYVRRLDDALQSSDDGQDVAVKAESVPVDDISHFCAGSFDPSTAEGPYHAYVLTLDNGCVVQFDMAWEECWGDVSLWNAAWNYGRRNEDGDPYGYQNGGAEESYVGFGNEVDGFRKIIQVYDEDEGCYITPFEFYRRTDKYVDNYSS